MHRMKTSTNSFEKQHFVKKYVTFSGNRTWSHLQHVDRVDFRPVWKVSRGGYTDYPALLRGQGSWGQLRRVFRRLCPCQAAGTAWKGKDKEPQTWQTLGHVPQNARIGVESRLTAMYDEYYTCALPVNYSQKIIPLFSCQYLIISTLWSWGSLFLRTR